MLAGGAAGFVSHALMSAADLSRILGHGMREARAMPAGGRPADGQCAANDPTSGIF